MDNLKFYINNLEWTLLFREETVVKTVYNELANSSSKYVFGFTDFPTLRIFVDKDLSSDILRRTLMHELIHAHLFSFGLDFEDYTEEDICNIMSSAMDTLIQIANELMEEWKDGDKRRDEE